MDASWLYMYMPIAGVNIFWPGLVLIGFSVGVIGGLQQQLRVLRQTSLPGALSQLVKEFRCRSMLPAFLKLMSLNYQPARPSCQRPQDRTRLAWDSSKKSTSSHLQPSHLE